MGLRDNFRQAARELMDGPEAARSRSYEPAPPAPAPAPKAPTAPPAGSGPKTASGPVEEVFRTLVAGPKVPGQAPTAEKLLDTLAAAEEAQSPAEDLSATRRVNINELKFGPNYRSESD